ncbi:MAG: DUF3578 domain-containing protein [Planctomycetaceae bacterium]|nr:DUF3578 domain-containing protein [Planctomycetaceae bacterium]
MTDTSELLTNAIPSSFWSECARLVESYATRPEKYSGSTEQAQLRDSLVQLSLALAQSKCPNPSWTAGASVGYGQWAQLPWLAVYDSRVTKTAQEGTYIVIHFSWEEPRGIRMGISVAAAEFKRNTTKRAREIRDELDPKWMQSLFSREFIDSTDSSPHKVELGSGKRASDYADSMVIEKFIPLSALKSASDGLSEDFEVLLSSYKSWADIGPRRHITGESPDFRALVRRYHDERIVFLSPNDKARYFIESVDDSGCIVRRLRGEAEKVTFSGYETKKDLVKQAGRIAKRGQLDNTVARHMCYVQSPELGLSADNQEVAYLGDSATAADHFIALIEALSSPKLYKPAILLAVLDGIETGELDTNCISFDWLLTRFHARLQRIGLEVGEQQLAEGFERLANDLFWMLAYHDISAIDPPSKPSAKRIRETVAYAVIKEPYWASLQNPAHLGTVREAVLKKWPDLRDSIEPPPVIDESDAMRSLIDRIRAKGFVFQPWQIAAYVTAIRTKPFVILAGVSGTGKSKLPMLVAELTGAVTPRRIAVRPDWTDSSDVVGYVDLQNQFRPGVVLQAMREASMNQQRFYVCLIDEMNLARVEHYFAEFLSAIEDRRPSEGGGFESSPLITQELSNDSEEWSDQTIPRNLAIVGTVNMDESTHGFSRKVLDRAFTIELSEIDLAGGLNKSDDGRPEAALGEWPITNWMCPASRLDEVDFNDPLNQKDIQRTVETLQRVNEVLVHAQLQVGYRTRDEIALFLINARSVTSAFVTNDGDKVDPLDLALMMKVLPRIAGGSNSVRRVLLGLLGIATNGSPLSADADPRHLIESWERESRPGAFSTGRFPRTASRLCLMWNRLEVEGYTSYWL